MELLVNRDLWTVINTFDNPMTDYCDRRRLFQRERNSTGEFVVVDKHHQLIAASPHIESKYLLRTIFTHNKKHIRNVLHNLGKRYIPNEIITVAMDNYISIKTLVYILKFWNFDTRVSNDMSSYCIKNHIVKYVFMCKYYPAINKIPQFLRMVYETNHLRDTSIELSCLKYAPSKKTVLPLIEWYYDKIPEIRIDFDPISYQYEPLSWTFNEKAMNFVKECIKNAVQEDDLKLMEWLEKQYTLSKSHICIDTFLKRQYIRSEKMFIYLKKYNFFTENPELLQFPLENYLDRSDGNADFIKWVLKHYGENRFKYKSRTFWIAIRYGNLEAVKLLCERDKHVTDKIWDKLDIFESGPHTISKLLILFMKNKELCSTLEVLSSTPNLIERFIDMLFQSEHKHSDKTLEIIISTATYEGKVSLLKFILKQGAIYNRKFCINLRTCFCSAVRKMLRYDKPTNIVQKYRYRVPTAIRLIYHSKMVFRKIEGHVLSEEILNDPHWKCLESTGLKRFYVDFYNKLFGKDVEY